MKKLIDRLCLFTLFIVCYSWTPQNIAAQSQSDQNLTIFAASSLTDAFTEIADVFMAAYDTKITLNFAGSSTLVAQIEQGAPADLFASASELQMQQLINGEYIAEDDIVFFAENTLVLIVPSSNPARIKSIADLAQSNVLLVLASEGVPIRQYTDMLFEQFATFYTPDFIEAVLNNVVSEEPNVRQVVARIALGEADAALVYRTDVTEDISDLVLVIEIPKEITAPIVRYPIVPIREASNPEAARLFIDFLESDPGREILHKWGFCLPISPTNISDALPELTPEPNLMQEEDACA